ncbi:MAG TPA: hypothetical protein VHO70_19010 [Chitinispirillaceae bacterium]|nr:hypothetical protein [Chitinispirillaceae bacterium]
MNKVALSIVFCVINVFSLSIFGVTIGDTTTRNVDTFLYIEPLKKTVDARLYYESGTIQTIECFVKNDTGSVTFVRLKMYFTTKFGISSTIKDIPGDEYCIWKAENCCIELSGQKTDSVVTIRIDASGVVRFEMLQQMEHLYDSISVIRNKKNKHE